MSAIDHAFTLLQMASKDIKALKAMTDAETFDDEIFGFHAQQAIEKSLKAWIVALGGTFGFTHDLRMLLLTLRDLGCEIEPLKDLVRLNVYAVQFRYEPMESLSGSIDRPALIARIESLRGQVEGVLVRVST